MQTVLPDPAVAGAQADISPTLSIERNCTMVVPTAVILMLLAVVVVPHVVPLLVDVWYW